VFAQPKSLGERVDVAHACALRLELSIPTLIEDMENSTDHKHCALLGAIETYRASASALRKAGNVASDDPPPGAASSSVHA
jgi:hypothetical protein